MSVVVFLNEDYEGGRTVVICLYGRLGYMAARAKFSTSILIQLYGRLGYMAGHITESHLGKPLLIHNDFENIQPILRHFFVPTL